MENVFSPSCACVVLNALFLVALSPGMLGGCHIWFFHNVFTKGTVWNVTGGILSIVATFRVGESPLNWTCIIVRTPGFHCRDFKLQRQGGSVMFIVVVKFRQGCMKQFQVTGTFVIAHA